MDIFRFITAGNVDDGKSTLIGKILLETNSIHADIESSIRDKKTNTINLAHLTDGLRAERDLGITIDVAYKYFSTDKRRFIIIDAPGHTQYTKNLVSAASQANLMIILIDINTGITPQTLVHLHVAWFMEIPEVIIAVNKLDLFDFDYSKFNGIKKSFAENFSLFNNYKFVPISALNGDNVVNKSAKTPWYNEMSIYEYLLNSKLKSTTSEQLIIQVQSVIKKNAFVYCYCRIESGNICESTELYLIKNLNTFNYLNVFIGYEKLTEANVTDNICFVVDENIDLKIGDLIVSKNLSITNVNKIQAAIVWLSNLDSLTLHKLYNISIGHNNTKCQINSISILKDNNTSESNTLEINQFAFIDVEFLDEVVISTITGKPLITKAVLLDSENGTTLAAINFNLIK